MIKMTSQTLMDKILHDISDRDALTYCRYKADDEKLCKSDEYWKKRVEEKYGVLDTKLRWKKILEGLTYGEISIFSISVDGVAIDTTYHYDDLKTEINYVLGKKINKQIEDFVGMVHVYDENGNLIYNTTTKKFDNFKGKVSHVSIDTDISLP